MMMVKLSNGMELPKDIFDAFQNSGNNILCAVYKDGEKFGTRDLKTTAFDLNLIMKIIEQNGWNKDGGEFAILDGNGVVYKSEGSNITVKADKNGYLYVNDDKLVIHAHKAGFAQGTTKEKLDQNYRRQIDMGFFYGDENFGDNGFTSKNKEIEFKDTIMGKMTKGAIINWGENNEKGEWFAPTEEQAEAMISEGGFKMGELTIDYSSSDKATNGKTYGSELAAIDGLVELMGNSEGMSMEEKAGLKEQIKEEIYTEASLSPELATRIKSAMEVKGTETSIIEVLGKIHDNWVKDNGNKFDDPKRAKKLHQFTDLRLMSYGGDGATADLLFLQPILEGAGIEVDVEGKLKVEFEKQQKEYMAEKGITDCKGLRDYLKNIEENYPTIQNVKT